MTTWLKCVFVFFVLIVIGLGIFTAVSIQTFRQSIDPSVVREIVSSFISFDDELPQKYTFPFGLSSFPGGALLVDDDKDKMVFMFFISPMDENEGNAQAIIDGRIAGESMSPINSPEPGKNR